MFKKIICWIFFFLLPVSSIAATDNRAAAETNAKLGLAYLQKGLYPASKNALLSAIKDDPKISAGWYSMAYYLEKTGHSTAAESYYRKAISVEPQSGAAQNNYGTFLCRTGRYAEAIQFFLSAAHQKEYLDAAGAYENAGTCSLMMHDNVQAMKYYHMALNNNPNMPFSLLSLARLNNQLGNTASAEKYFSVFKKLELTGKPASVITAYENYVFAPKNISPP